MHLVLLLLNREKKLSGQIRGITDFKLKNLTLSAIVASIETLNSICMSTPMEYHRSLLLLCSIVKISYVGHKLTRLYSHTGSQWSLFVTLSNSTPSIKESSLLHFTALFEHLLCSNK